MTATKYRILGLIFVILIPLLVMFNFEDVQNRPNIFAIGFIFVLFFTSLYSMILDHLPIELTDEVQQMINDQKANTPILKIVKYILNIMIIIGLLIMILGLIQKILE